MAPLVGLAHRRVVRCGSIWLYISSAHEIGATRAQGVFVAAPFIGATLSFALLGEPFGLAQAAACALMVASISALVFSQHAHLHAHAELDHVHSDRHDDGHHLHEHPGLAPEVRHSHAHRHARLVHGHPHWPDLHHRHDHVHDIRSQWTPARKARACAGKRPSEATLMCAFGQEAQELSHVG
jgi:hypothetical protein